MGIVEYSEDVEIPTQVFADKRDVETTEEAKTIAANIIGEANGTGDQPNPSQPDGEQDEKADAKNAPKRARSVASVRNTNLSN
jgi:hypothetical protein